MISSALKIATHNGHFHCDEVLAMALIRKHPKFQNSTIIRSRDPSILAEADMVIDVGGEFILEKNRFDHHQKGFLEVFGQEKHNKTKLSSAGLIYKYYGKEIMQTLYNIQDEATLQSLYIRIYEELIESIDAIDNGISVASDGTPLYKIRTDLGSRVDRLNPSWNSKKLSSEEEMERFSKAMEIAFTEFDSICRYTIDSWLPAKAIAKEAFDNRFNVHSSGRIVEFKTPCPHKEHISKFEEEAKVGEAVLFTLFEERDSWRVGTMNVSGSAFTPRLPLHKKLLALRDEELSRVADIEDLVFVHATGFIGGAKNRESALKLAVLSLEQLNEKPE